MIMVPGNPSKASPTTILFQATWGNKQQYETCKRPLPTKSLRLQAAEPQGKGKAQEIQTV